MNDTLTTEPGLVNTSPYGDGWLFRLKPASATFGGLLDAAAYQQLLDAEG